MKVIKNIRLKEYQYFNFSINLRGNFEAIRYEEATGEIQSSK
jgi:hypothetical protein